MDGISKELWFNLGELEYKAKMPECVLSNIYELDRLVQGFTLDCVTIWTGVTNAGKTTMLTLLANETIKQGHRVFYFNGEQTPDVFLNNLMRQNAESKDIYELRKENTPLVSRFVREEKATKLKNFYDNKLFLFNNEAPRDIDSLLFAMEECRRTKGVRVFILDNFMQIDLVKDDVYQEQSRIMEKLRTFAVTKKVHIHLVAHPRKTAEFQTRLSLYDISGSMNLANKAYNVISIMRTDSIDEESAEHKKLETQLINEGFDLSEAGAVLEVLKTKGEGCGLVPLRYDKTLKTYQSISPLDNLTKERRKQEIMSKSRRQ